MTSDGTTQSGRRRPLTWVGGSVAVVALLQFLPGMLGTFELQKWVGVCVSALIFLLGALVAHHSARNASRAQELERETSLRSAMLRWPAPQLATVPADDIGVRAGAGGGDAPYVPRDRDAQMDAALEGGLVLIVFGPAGAGTSRSAFEAAKRWAARTEPSAVVLAPRDADGLDRLMDEPRAGLLGTNARGVLWIDGLERYLGALSIDRVLAFMLDPPPIAVVATIHEDELERLHASASTEGHLLRQLSSRGAGVRLAGELSTGELERFRELRGVPADAPAVAAAFADPWHDGWQRPSRDLAPPAADPPGVDVLGGALVAAVLACVAVLVPVGLYHGWRTAPAIGAQIRALEAGDAACQRSDEYPKGGAKLARTGDPDDGVLVTVVSGRGCRQSDEIRLHRLGTDERLAEVAVVRPTATERKTFACIGPAVPDPCHVRLQGKTEYVVGAFADSATDRELPVVMTLYDEGVQLTSPAPPADAVPEGYEDPVTLPIAAGGNVLGGRHDGACSRTGASCHDLVQASIAAVAPEDEEHPALLLLAYEVAQDRLRVAMWELRIEDGRPTIGDDCIAARDGHPRALRVKRGTPAQVRAAMAPAAFQTGTRIIC